jgi:hypothetical protein
VKQVPLHSQEHENVSGQDALPRTVINWQHGPIGEDFNGATVEGVLRAAILRLEDLNRAIPCSENGVAISHLNEALAALDRRTRDRYERGVMGTRQA